MARRKQIPLPPIVIRTDMPCKGAQQYVAADGSCLRCGADQGVACRDTMERDISMEAWRLEALTRQEQPCPSR
jgi:hypothetical protein